MTWKKYVSQYEGKSVAVLGLGVSNIPLAHMLLDAGMTLTVRDKRDRASLGDVVDEMESRGAKFVLGDEYLSNLDEDVIFRSPGIMPHKPEIAEAVARGAELTSEMEAFFALHPCTIIGVTGSDGKTTTTTLIAEFLRAEGKTVHLGGNIGTPLLEKAGAMKSGDYAVLELSSFQLMTMKKSADIAVVTNVAPNHLDMHTDMREYIDAKMNIFMRQRANQRVVLNYDNDVTRGFAEVAPGSLLFFSRKNMLYKGVYLSGDNIVANVSGGAEEMLNISVIRIPGDHVIENFMAAIAVVHGLVSRESISRVAQEFYGVEHRIEYVKTVNDVRYYNDSSASSPTRTRAGLRAFDEKVILIAGGRDKGVPYDELAPEIIEHVKTLILTGETAAEIRRVVTENPLYTGTPEIITVNEFDDAVYAARDAASPGDTVLMSPASTSFDKFKNFAERGAYYKMMVNNMF